MDFYASKFPVMLLTRTALQEWTKKGLYIMYALCLNMSASGKKGERIASCNRKHDAEEGV